MTVKRTYVIGIVALLALLGAACGSDGGSDDSEDTTAAPVTTAAPNPDFAVALDEICADLDETLTEQGADQDAAIDSIVDDRDLEDLDSDELAAVAEVFDNAAADLERTMEQFAADATEIGLPAEAQEAVDDAVEVISILVEIFPQMADAVAAGDGQGAVDIAEEAEESGAEDAAEVGEAFDALGVDACGSSSESFSAAESDDAVDEEAFADDLNDICADARAAGDVEEAAFTDALLGLQAAGENGLAAGDPDYDRAIAEAVFALDTVISNSEDTIAQIEALDAPAEADAALSDFVALQQDSIENATELSAAFAADDGPAISALFDEAETTDASREARRQRLADELGASECAPEPD